MATPVTTRPIEYAILALKEALSARAADGASVREHHSHGESYHTPAAPDIVCFPRTTAEVASIVAVSARFQVPVVPFGAGTSLEGHVNAIHGGISIDLREMNRLVRLSVDDLDVTVEAGVTRLQLNKALRHTGLTFPIDPGADATIGGMRATRASGTTAVRYGTMRENVLGLTVVLAARSCERRRAGRGQPPERAHGAPGAGDGRDVQRRARRRHRQDEISRSGTRPSARRHAHDQARARSGQSDEPREDDQ
jgi:FAD/FMN-containing dehydrogenase